MEKPFTGLLQAGNPFAEIEETGWFAADQEPRHYPFTLYGRPCHVDLRAMDASAASRFQGKIMALPGKIQGLADDEAKTALFDDLQLDLLLATVVDCQLVERGTATTGDPVVTQTPPWKGLRPEQQRDIFRRANPRAREIAVRLCAEVNAIDPLLLGIDPTPGSDAASPASETSTAGSG